MWSVFYHKKIDKIDSNVIEQGFYNNFKSLNIANIPKSKQNKYTDIAIMFICCITINRMHTIFIVFNDYLIVIEFLLKIF